MPRRVRRIPPESREPQGSEARTDRRRRQEPWNSPRTSQRDSEHELGSFTGHANDLELPTMVLCDSAATIEAEPEAIRSGRVERIENLRNHIRRNPPSVVPHPIFGGIALHLRGYREGSRRATHGLKRIENKVNEQVFALVRIGLDRRHRFHEVDRESHTRRSNLGL